MPRSRRWPALVLVALGLIAGVNVQRGREQRLLADCRERTAAGVGYVVAKARSVEQYAGSALTAAGTPPRVRASLERLVTGTVASELPSVLRDRERCDYRTLPWSGDARDAYLRRLDPVIAVLRRAATDLDALRDPVLETPLSP